MPTVTLAKSYARRIVDGEMRTTGQPVVEVVRHVARRLRQPYGSIWSLLYRNPKTVRADLLAALQEAVEKQVRLEISSLENELLAVRLGAAHRSETALVEIAAGIEELKAKLRGDQQ
ncbi:hypothetical protein [Methylobacterium sp. Gmos1]